VFRYKQVIAVRADLKMSKGKLASQVAHASLAGWKLAKPGLRKAWEAEGTRKIVVEVKNEAELLSLERKVKKARLPAFLVSDRGLTEVPPGTLTCLGIGPARAEKLDRLTSSLRLLK